jgi:hypothetical protein
MDSPLLRGDKGYKELKHALVVFSLHDDVVDMLCCSNIGPMNLDSFFCGFLAFSPEVNEHLSTFFTPAWTIFRGMGPVGNKEHSIVSDFFPCYRHFISHFRLLKLMVA